MIRLIAIITALFCFFFLTPVQAGDITIFQANGSHALQVKSIKELRFQRVVKQEYDFSCGSAALATLLTYHYDLPTDEEETLEWMYDAGDKEKILREGFSMLDMKAYLKSVGLRADGYKESLDTLKKVGIPAIALLDTRGYLHFVVIKGVTPDYVLVGDPALGMKAMEREDFEKSWNGILFVVNQNVQHVVFNDQRDWKMKRKSPFKFAVDDAGLSGFGVSTAYTPNYF